MSAVRRFADGSIEPWECPRCHNITTDYPALSRADNKTDVCSACGTQEALLDWLRHEKEIKANENTQK